jgi:signal transduction histidine kinase
LITRRALMSRVHSIRQTVSAIIHGDLKHRLPTHLSDDELNTLARTINGMLEQIELLVHGVRNVSNSIAHDLRTPLAELRSRLEELALMRPPPERTFTEIDGAVADVDRVIHIFDALLRLAEIDAGMRRSGFVALDLVELAGTAVEFYAPAAELKNIALTFHADGALPVSGDPVLLAQALSNLIDNALKYAPEHGAIDVAVRHRADGAAEIAVTDNGPGIDDSEKTKVVERFYRGDASRGTPGVGLGLSLVQAVARLHGSTLELADQNPGLRAALVLPAGEAVPAKNLAAALGAPPSAPITATTTAR